MLFFFYWILYLGTSALIWTTAQARPRSSHGVVKRELGHFEERYINTLNYKLHNETVKLIGYKKIKIPLEEIDAFEDHYFTNYAELRNSILISMIRLRLSSASTSRLLVR
jgi:hypothetical protein